MPFTHYTDTIGSLVGILRHGFAFRATRRHLIESLAPYHDWSKREPQQFGIVSFTEMETEEASRHFTQLPFGVRVSYGWALKNKVERVIYIREDGPSLAAWRSIFQIGYVDLKKRIRYSFCVVLSLAYWRAVTAGGKICSMPHSVQPGV